MTIEEVFRGLSDRYGEEFNWSMIPSDMARERFVRELKRELGEENELFRNGISAVAKSDACDDVLFWIGDDAAGAWRVYHLTYSSVNAAGYPRYEELADFEAVRRYIEERLF